MLSEGAYDCLRSVNNIKETYLLVPMHPPAMTSFITLTYFNSVLLS